MTDRGFVFGWEYYGTFTRALFTLFQVMTGESWAEAVARPLMFGLYKNAIFVSVFFVSFILLTQIVLTNVVVAVLLDKFVEDPPGKVDGDKEPPQQVDAASFLDGFDDPGAASASTATSGGIGGAGAIAAMPQGAPSDSRAPSAPPMASSRPQLPQQAGVESYMYAAAGAGGLIGNKSTDEKLSMLLVEIISLRVAVGRCEAGLDELRNEQRVRKGSTSSDRTRGAVLGNGKATTKSTPRKV